jgi:hypothetical protein
MEPVREFVHGVLFLFVFPDSTHAQTQVSGAVGAKEGAFRVIGTQRFES